MELHEIIRPMFEGWHKTQFPGHDPGGFTGKGYIDDNSNTLWIGFCAGVLVSRSR